ncbi:hypothetical protein L596_006980 [Steinernema carpocapsae]|uniref:Uncharacterized protein n=1 Tax=Steinernema carpocapsae TaxID=34508 RepID=A0A4U5P7R3_STECR|nr:hypothetical protein L596_006980 [Steinernema carpocapsae]
MDSTLTFNAIVLGDFGVGKTSLLNKYNSYMTLSPVPNLKEVILQDKSVNVKFRDTGSLEMLGTLPSPYYKNAQAVVFVYDITKFESFENLEKWRKRMESHLGSEELGKIYGVVVGTKVDLVQNREVDDAYARFWASKYGYPHFEVSSGDKLSVEMALNKVEQLFVEDQLRREKLQKESEELKRSLSASPRRSRRTLTSFLSYFDFCGCTFAYR